MWNILLVEDQDIVRQGLKLMLEQDERMNVLGEATNGKEALQFMESHLIDLVVMDIRMPELNGIEATREIKQRWSATKVLILTTFNDDEYALEALKLGASGFLLKTSDRDKLLSAVVSCMNGGMSIHEEVAAKVMPRLLEKSKPPSSKEIKMLTSRELAVIKLVGEGLTNKEVSQRLHLSVGTVKNHLTQILQKLHLRDRTQLAIYAIKNDVV
ncbi:DNA-binding NarL/FixJ family response regulator [Bacillus pakistanensis]|uniref:DNA-binding NarL/FixJ family response regulator n=1 Tax=Rossellomorea pakistanensis TaxID=992288 RepID=A0ABS2NJN9_9BACI|nr:response regulator transcription factor [Bacillus pakistanensis]MBM7588067.1 DNA-binding NarL/FixJ family response regulator [Bacillus pakistanensis]